jgi:MFS family permease
MPFFARFVPFRELWSLHNLRWLVLIRFLANVIFYSTVIVQYESSRGLNFTEMFLLESIISLAALVFAVPTGILADQLGYRGVLLLGYGLCLASVSIFALTYGFWWFAFSDVLFGAGIASISGCEDALMYESLPTEGPEALGRVSGLATAAFALLNAASSAGFVLGLCVGSFLGARSPALAVMVSIVPMTLAWMMTLQLHPVGRRVSQRNDRRKMAPPRAGDLWRWAMRFVREQPTVVGLSLFSSSAFALVQAIFWYNQPYFTRAGIAVAWFGPLTAAAVGVQMLVTLSTPRVKQRLGQTTALVLSCILPGIAYLLLPVVRMPALVAVLVATVASASAWRQPIVNDELNRRMADGARATTLSVLSLLGTLAGVVLNPLIGHVGDLGLNVTGVSLGLSLVLLGCVVPLLMGKRAHLRVEPGVDNTQDP